MESITFFEPRLYSDANIYIVFAFSIVAYIIYSPMDNEKLLETNIDSNPLVKVYMWLFIIVVGLRPINGVFGDMRSYTWSFEALLEQPTIDLAIGETKEWIWAGYCYIVGKIGGVNMIFFTTTLLYVLFSYLAICRMFKFRRDVVLLFLFGFFSFFAYATNTIRAGLALSITLLAISFFIPSDGNRKIRFLIGASLTYIAFSIHRSSLLPICALILSLTILKNLKINIFLWVLCVILSFIVGSELQDVIVDFIAGVDFEDSRLEQYIGNEASDEIFLRTGFRWDFILFSTLPIIVGVYVLNLSKKEDQAYSILLNTYLIANMFWVLVNRAAFSDRIAYLSWFLYPIVVAYPFLHIYIKPYQGALLSKLLLIVSGFTLLMKIAYYD